MTWAGSVVLEWNPSDQLGLLRRVLAVAFPCMHLDVVTCAQQQAARSGPKGHGGIVKDNCVVMRVNVRYHTQVPLPTLVGLSATPSDGLMVRLRPRA